MFTFALSSCALPKGRIRLPKALAASAISYPVEGRKSLFNLKICFGPYRMLELRRSPKTSDVNGATALNGRRYTRLTQMSYSFLLHGPAGARRGPWRVACVNQAEAFERYDREVLVTPDHLTSRPVTSESARRASLRCALEGPGRATRELVMRSSQTSTFTGSLEGGPHPIEVVPTDDAVDEPFGARVFAGWLFIEHERPVAAADTLHYGRVILDRTSPPADQDLFAAAAAALMMFPDIR